MLSYIQKYFFAGYQAQITPMIIRDDYLLSTC